MLAEVECGLVWCTSDKWSLKDMATLEQLPHPFSAKSVRHNVAGVIMSLDLALFGLLDAAFDGFAIGCIEGHS